MKRSLQAVFFPFFQERFAADAEDFGGFGDVVASGLESLDDDVALDFFKGAKAEECGCAAGCGANVFRKILGCEFGAFAKNDGSFEHIAKFADVAGPSISGEHPSRSIAEIRVWAIVNGAERNQQEVGKRKDVRTAFTKRRNGNRENIEAEKKIFAELARGDGGVQVQIGDGDEARFDAKSFCAAQALEGALLQNAKQFCLRVGGERRNFVEDDSAGTAEFEAAEFAVNRPSE